MMIDANRDFVRSLWPEAYSKEISSVRSGRKKWRKDLKFIIYLEPYGAEVASAKTLSAAWARAARKLQNGDSNSKTTGGPTPRDQ